MDLVPRINGEQVDADKCSITRLYRVHVSSAKIAGADKVYKSIVIWKRGLTIAVLSKIIVCWLLYALLWMF